MQRARRSRRRRCCRPVPARFDLGIQAVFGPGSEKETARQMRSSWEARVGPIAAMGPGPRLECAAVTSHTVGFYALRA